MSQTYFTPATFAFLRDLANNNRRQWFNANRDRYEDHVKVPALRFIEDFRPRLAKVSAHFRADARPVGGSLFRIYRDVRFSKDKRPYMIHTGIQFRHAAAKDVHAPGFYLHLEPRNVFMGCGVWHPDGPSLQKIRSRIVDDPAAWKRTLRAKKFAGRFQLGGESLKRAPRGIDPEHALIEDLKRKDFIAFTPLLQRDVTGTKLTATMDGLCRASTGFQRFLCNAVGVPF